MTDIKRILAVAVGPRRDHVIGPDGNGAPAGVRPYVSGLIAELSHRGRRLGSDHEIHYRERPQHELAGKSQTAFMAADGKPYDLIFAMSTNVVRAALDSGESIPIVGVVSEPRAEGFSRARNITGISARRSQTAGQCFEHFLATLPTLKRVHVLHKPGYGPSDRSLKLVRAAAKRRGVTVAPLSIKTPDDIEKKLKAMAKRDPKEPATLGLLVLPVDVAFGASQKIIEIAQVQKNVPTFWPITDPVMAGALGGYGVPQHTCGMLMAHYVDQILWHSAAPKSLKVTEAEADAFEWLVNTAAAKALNLKLPRLI